MLQIGVFKPGTLCSVLLSQVQDQSSIHSNTSRPSQKCTTHRESKISCATHARCKSGKSASVVFFMVECLDRSRSIKDILFQDIVVSLLEKRPFDLS